MALQLVHPEVQAPAEVQFDIPVVPSLFHTPRVFTHERVGRLADANAAARTLRTLGFRVVDIDALPDDDGRPVLLIDLNGHSVEQLVDQCDASTRRTASSRVTGVFQGVRVVTQGADQ